MTAGSRIIPDTGRLAKEGQTPDFFEQQFFLKWSHAPSAAVVTRPHSRLDARPALSHKRTVPLPPGSTQDGMTAVTVVAKDADDLPVSWTVLVHVVAVEGYTVEEQAWGGDELGCARGFGG